MKLIIEPVGMALTASLRRAVEEQMAHLEKFFAESSPVELRVEIGKPSAHHKKGNVYYAEANLRIGKTLLRVTDTNLEIHVAIDNVRHMLERQLRKQKEKRISSRHKKGS